MPALPLVRVRLKYPDVETLVERFAPNVTRGGIFLASREPKAVGTTIRFEVSLLTGTPVLSGEGKVTWVKPFDPNAPTRPHGMGVSFNQIDPSCTEMFRRLVERREVLSRRSAANGASEGARHNGETREPAAAFATELEAIDDGAYRRTLDRARTLAGRVDNVEDLLNREADEPPTLEQALADLPRYLQTRRGTGGNRITPETRPETSAPAADKAKDDEEPQ